MHTNIEQRTEEQNLTLTRAQKLVPEHMRVQAYAFLIYKRIVRVRVSIDERR